MSSNRTTVCTALATLKGQFERESANTARLAHCSVVVNRPVSEDLVRQVAEEVECRVVRIIQWPREDGSVRYSCFLGSSDRLTAFDRLAEAAERCYVEITQQLLPGSPGPTHSPADAWIARAYDGDHCRSGRGLLSFDRCWAHARETLNRKACLTWFEDYSETDYDMKTDTNVNGEPLAEFYVVKLRHDVFTVSAAVLDRGIKALPDKLHDVKLDLSAVTDCDRGMLSQVALRALAIDDTPPSPLEPATVCASTGETESVADSDPGGDYIGPASNEEFAIRAMHRSVATLNRARQKHEIIRKDVSGGYLFRAVDPVAHSKYKKNFEENRKAGERLGDV